MQLRPDIRDGLKKAIHQSGMKQTVVAERAGLKANQLCDIINKRRKLEANELIRLCHTIGLTPEKMYELAKKTA